MKEYRRRGRPPKNADEYLTNLAQTMKMLKRRRELAAQVEELTKEAEHELELFCLNCTQKNCEHGDCQPLRDKQKTYATDKPTARRNWHLCKYAQII